MKIVSLADNATLAAGQADQIRHHISRAYSCGGVTSYIITALVEDLSVLLGAKALAEALASEDRVTDQRYNRL
jgi:hypothetical protein